MVTTPWPLPRVVVAAPASGHGKTTIATGLLAALRRRGHRVSPHKVGPDYIDPGYHALAAGRPGRNLDPWLVGEERIAGLLRHGAAVPSPADIAVVEGVMGLHDGAVGHRGYASTAHVARLVAAPVLLVLDTTAQGRSAAALALGMGAFDPAVRIGGVVLNRVGSPRHESLLRDALAEVGVPVLGAVTRAAEVAAPSRHLGLVPVAERAAESIAVVDALADLVGATVDLDAVLELARPSLSATPRRPSCSPPPVGSSSPLTRYAMRRCRPALGRWLSAGASPRCTWRRSPPTPGCAPIWPPSTGRWWPSAQACSTWDGNWTVCRCAADST